MKSVLEIIEINVRSNIRRNLAKHDELLFSHKNLYRIHLHLTSDRM